MQGVKGEAEGTGLGVRDREEGRKEEKREEGIGRGRKSEEEN